MIVRAKFIVESVTDYGDDHKLVTLRAVSHGPENETWSKYTPTGVMTMTVTNPEAGAVFIPRTEYYLDFTQVTVTATVATQEDNTTNG